MIQQLQGKASVLYRARAGRVSRNFVARQGLSLAVPTGVASSREALASFSAIKRQLHWPCRMMKRQEHPVQTIIPFVVSENAVTKHACPNHNSVCIPREYGD